MLKMSEPYTVSTGRLGYACFKVTSDKPKTNELFIFWNENQQLLDKPRFDADDNAGLELKEKNREKIKNLVYRFNMSLMGKDLQLAKREFLNQCGLEAIKSVVYATDFIPDGMTIDEYSAVILKAYEDYNDSVDFDDRLINIAGLPANQLNLIINQIQLFKTLLLIPYEEEADVEINDRLVG